MLNLANEKIACIKAIRKGTGMGLKEAKYFVEDLQRRVGTDYANVNDTARSCVETILTALANAPVDNLGVKRANDLHDENTALRRQLEDFFADNSSLGNEVASYKETVATLRRQIVEWNSSYNLLQESESRQRGLKVAALKTLEEVVLLRERD